MNQVNQAIPRLEKAFELLQKEKIDLLAYPFYSITSDGKLRVVNPVAEICTCEDNFFRKTKCKHIYAIRIYNGMEKIHK